jgi:hypothetical protein
MRPVAKRETSLAFEVAIVSANPETLDGLQSYLSSAGVRARCTRDVAECARFAPATTTAFVLFPDDFQWEKVAAAIGELRELRPRALRVLVTSHPRRLEELASADSDVVVARPAWGWTILDAIRAHVGGEMAQ